MPPTASPASHGDNGSTMYDVAIIGGGPGGSTASALLKKYNPNLRIVVLERETFPREHVGESQLPAIGAVLHEMGVWDKVEAAGFPVKLGATYTWGRTTEPWVFGFIPMNEVKDDPRPAKFEGWRRRVALQVDRARYDTILLRHAADMGVEVREGVRVVKVRSEQAKSGTRVTGFELDDGTVVAARYYIDASGNAAIMRRQLGIGVDAPTLLRNVAFWDYWSRPGLNESLLETKAIRVQIRSLGYGWIWYIALSNDRTSVGLVCNAEYYKESGKRPEEIYRESLAKEAQISRLLTGATSENEVRSTTDWSYVADEACGPNWFLVGECLGFADPILAAGLTLTHTCAQHCAYTILELDRGRHEATWLLQQYRSTQTKRVRQHMKFAEYWYAANGIFSDIHENCTKIAEASGLKLSPAEAFRWLSNGGIDDHLGQFSIGGLTVGSVKQTQARFSLEGDGVGEYTIDDMNVFTLNLMGATRTHVAHPHDGVIEKVAAYTRGVNTLPEFGIYKLMLDVLKKHKAAHEIMGALREAARNGPAGEGHLIVQQAMYCLETMVTNGWVKCSNVPGQPSLKLTAPLEGQIVFSEKLGPPKA